MIVKSHKPLLVTRRSCIVPTALDSLSFAAVLCVTGGRAFKTIE
ncbi:hypothetical protein QWZ13_18170 [Reinekea marina]|nr:hypothetical protein [Reinekea marina]MDN3649597.1 hypothetical protein [Reinekea marina]MDN3650837.1 hypothetical protein [Reinekea marina]